MQPKLIDKKKIEKNMPEKIFYRDKFGLKDNHVLKL